MFAVAPSSFFAFKYFVNGHYSSYYVEKIIIIHLCSFIKNLFLNINILLIFNELYINIGLLKKFLIIRQLFSKEKSLKKTCIKMENFLKLPSTLRKFLLFSEMSYTKSLQTLLFSINIIFMSIIGLLCGATMFQDPFAIETFMSGLMLSTVTLLAIVKYSVIYYNWKDIQKIIKGLPRRSSKKESLKDSKARKNFKTFCSVFIIYSLVSVITVLIEAFRFALKKSFPLHIKFPFDTSSNIIYLITFFSYLYAHLLLVFVNNFCDIFIYEIIFTIAMEFRILNREFSELKIDENADCGIPVIMIAPCNSDNKILKPNTKNLRPITSLPTNVQNLIDLLKKHSNLLENVEEIKKIFEIPFSFTFIVSSSIICSILFRISLNSYQIPILFFGLIINFNKIFLQCFFGQFLNDLTLEVSNGIFYSDWFDIEDEKVKKLIIVAIKRSQKSDGFKILKFMNVNMEQFVVVLEAAYSYFMLCRTLYYDE